MSRVLVAVVMFLLIPAAGFGQSGPYHAIVVDPEVKLRAGPSDKYPETTLLRKGDTVIVHDEENGWLAVQDPPQVVRSISWVRTQVVNFDKTKPIPQLVVVDESGATLRAGEIGVAQPSSIQKAKVPAGTILTVIGPGVSFAEGTWYPVVPPAGDHRYLPKHAVKYDKPATATFTVRDTTPPAVSPAGGEAPAASIPSALAAGGKNVNHPLWAQAEAAERDGRSDEAERIYFALARAMNEPGGDHDIANLCYTRIHAIREKKRGIPSGSTSNTRPAAADSSRPPSTGRVPTPAAVESDPARKSGPARLVRSNIGLDGRTTYRLEDERGNAVMYAVPAQGVDLERYIGKRVDLTGVVHTRQGLSKPYIVTTAIEPVQ
jgi:SH3 domain-containing protein